MHEASIQVDGAMPAVIACPQSLRRDIDVEKLTVQRTDTPGTLPRLEELVFGKTFTGLLTSGSSP